MPPGGTLACTSDEAAKTQKAYAVSLAGVRKSAGVRLDGSSRHFQDAVPPPEPASFKVDASPAKHPWRGPERQLPEVASHRSQSGQVTVSIPAHLPAPSHASDAVQTRGPSHEVPASAAVPPAHAPPVQLAPIRHGSPQAVPSGSMWQVDEQQSPSRRLPSSHCSSGSRVPSPQARVPVNVP